MSEDAPSLITIITVCFNAATVINDTIVSILNQQYQHFEYIVIDGASTDGTIDIIKNFETKFRDRGISFSLISEADEGVYYAMNKGIKMAKGEWINFMNAGDKFYNNEVLSLMFSTNTNSDILFGKAYYTDTNKLITPFKRISHLYILRHLVISHQAIFARKTVLSEGFDLSYKITADFNWLLSCFFSKKKIEARNVPVVFYAGNGISSNLEVARKETFRVTQHYYGSLITNLRRALCTINDVRKKIIS